MTVRAAVGAMLVGVAAGSMVDYTAPNGTLTVTRYHVSTDPNVADPASGEVLLTIPHATYPNHNGGLVMFGPDGYLYIGTGDEGSGGDPLGSGQDSTMLLGKILRIDVDGATPNAIPPTNPFVNRAPAAPEVPAATYTAAPGTPPSPDAISSPTFAPAGCGV